MVSPLFDDRFSSGDAILSLSWWSKSLSRSTVVHFKSKKQWCAADKLQVNFQNVGVSLMRVEREICSIHRMFHYFWSILSQGRFSPRTALFQVRFCHKNVTLPVSIVTLLRVELQLKFVIFSLTIIKNILENTQMS